MIEERCRDAQNRSARPCRWASRSRLRFTPSPTPAASDSELAIRPPTRLPQRHSQRRRRGSGSGSGWTITAHNLRHVSPCRVHSFGSGEYAYVTDCQGISEGTDGKDLLLVAVKLTDGTKSALSFNLENFLVVTSEGQTYDPVDVRSDYDYAPWLMPRSGLVAPGKSREALYTFDEQGNLRAQVVRLHRRRAND